MRIFLFRNPGPDLSFGTADDGPLENPLCDGTALYWEHDKTVNSHLLAAYKGGYGIYNGATGFILLHFFLLMMVRVLS